MDDDDFKDQMARLRKYRRETELTPLLLAVLIWAGMWWQGVDLEPQIEAVLAVVAVTGYLIFREVRSLHATFMHSKILEERGRHIRI